MTTNRQAFALGDGLAAIVVRPLDGQAEGHINLIGMGAYIPIMGPAPQALRQALDAAQQKDTEA